MIRASARADRTTGSTPSARSALSRLATAAGLAAVMVLAALLVPGGTAARAAASSGAVAPSGTLSAPVTGRMHARRTEAQSSAAIGTSASASQRVLGSASTVPSASSGLPTGPGAGATVRAVPGSSAARDLRGQAVIARTLHVGPGHLLALTAVPLLVVPAPSRILLVDQRVGTIPTPRPVGGDGSRAPPERA